MDSAVPPGDELEVLVDVLVRPVLRALHVPRVSYESAVMKFPALERLYVASGVWRMDHELVEEQPLKSSATQHPAR